MATITSVPLHLERLPEIEAEENWVIDFDSLSETKKRFLEALMTLPEETLIVQDGEDVSFAKFALSEVVQHDIEYITNLWNFLQEYRDITIIALVGMVNVGKSALGNCLLRSEQSGVFQEEPIRQTSKPEQAWLNDNTIIIDLPGLGSVLSEEDDAIVKSVLRRANLILLVLDINYPIPSHLYEFLKSDIVLKSKQLQSIVIVINKVDSLSELPTHIQQKQIQSYIDFLQHGNQKMDFEGIAKLFDYEIPIIPFSVVQARYRDNYSQDNELRQLIKDTLENSTNNALYRAETELQEIISKYIVIAFSYSVLCQQAQELVENISFTIESILDGTKKLIDRDSTNLLKQIEEIRESCFSDLGKYATTAAERFWEGENFQRKKQRSIESRDRHQSSVITAFNTFEKNLLSSISLTTTTILGEGFDVYLPDNEQVIKKMRESIWEIWDAFDDYWFLDKDRDAFEYSLEQSGNAFNEAIVSLSEWISEFWEEFNEFLDTYHTNLPAYKEYSHLRSYIDGAEKFVEILFTIDYVRAMIEDSN